MKSVIIYYSYSGNTKKVAEVLAEYLKGKGEVEVIELKDLKEDGKFLSQCRKALYHKLTEIQEENTDLLSFDLICIGTPVWAFGPVPAINAYLDKCLGIEGKEIILFTTYGSGTGNGRCINYMQRALAKKGAKGFKRFSVQQYKVKDREFVLERIKEAK
jgi:flavodoxin